MARLLGRTAQGYDLNTLFTMKEPGLPAQHDGVPARRLWLLFPSSMMYCNTTI